MAARSSAGDRTLTPSQQSRSCDSVAAAALRTTATRDGGHGRCHQAGPLEFICQWPTLGISETRVSTDAELILGAARRSVQLWSEDGA